MTNPVFGATAVAGAEQPFRARQSLVSIIDLSERIKRNAEKQVQDSAGKKP